MQRHKIERSERFEFDFYNVVLRIFFYSLTLRILVERIRRRRTVSLENRYFENKTRGRFHRRGGAS